MHQHRTRNLQLPGSLAIRERPGMTRGYCFVFFARRNDVNRGCTGCIAANFFTACQTTAAGRACSFADPITGRAPNLWRRRMGQDVRSPRGPRCIALVGPFQSGKTTLLEAILARTGAIPRMGTVDAGTSVGDSGREARRHKMSVDLSVATTTFMGDTYTFIDCPGSVEFSNDMRSVLPACDAAVVVCEADEKKLPQLQLILRELEELKIPRFLFLNKIDKADTRLRDVLALMQPASRVPLLLRQIPLWNGDIVTG